MHEHFISVLGYYTDVQKHIASLLTIRPTRSSLSLQTLDNCAASVPVPIHIIHILHTLKAHISRTWMLLTMPFVKGGLIIIELLLVIDTGLSVTG